MSDYEDDFDHDDFAANNKTSNENNSSLKYRQSVDQVYLDNK